MIMMNNSNLGTQQLNSNSQGMDSSTPVTAFLRSGAPAPGMMGSMQGNSNPMAAAMMNQMSQMNQMNQMQNQMSQMNQMNQMNGSNSQMNQMQNLNLNDLKRLQQLHQLQNTPTNPLLSRQQADPSAAILQSYLDQKVQTSRFDESFRQTLGMGSQAGNLLSNNLLQERFMMNQNALCGNQGAGNNANGELPLPSPHSLFNRDGSRRMRGGVIEPFPEKLHRLLLEVEAAGRSDVISFVANGRAFAIHKPDKFFKEIVPLYFRQSRLSSFKRQLNLYGFELINTGPARGGYYHELFVKDRSELCRRMRRVAVKVVPKGGEDSDPLDSPKKPATGDDELEKADSLLKMGKELKTTTTTKVE